MDDQTELTEDDGPDVEPSELIPIGNGLSKTALAATRGARERANGVAVPKVLIPQKRDGTPAHVYHRIGYCRVADGIEATIAEAEEQGLNPCPNCIQRTPVTPDADSRKRCDALRDAWLEGGKFTLQQAREKFSVTDTQFHSVKRTLRKKGHEFAHMWVEKSRCEWWIAPPVPAADINVVPQQSVSVPILANPPRMGVMESDSDNPPLGAHVQVVGLRLNPDLTVTIELQDAGGEISWLLAVSSVRQCRN